MNNISKHHGFTLMELMIVVAIISLLAGISYPAYTKYVLQAKRGDAKAGLLKLQLAQEKYKSYNVSYGTLAQLATNDSSITDPMASTDGHYAITILTPTSSGYSLKAVPSHTDGDCTALLIDQDNAKTATGADSNHCW